MTTLLEWLRGRTDEELAQLLTARPDLALPVPADLAGLAARLAMPASVRRACEQLDDAELQVLGKAAVGPIEDPRAEPALQRLRGLALVWGDDLQMSQAARDIALRVAGVTLGRPVRDLLARQPVRTVRAVAANLDLVTDRDPSAILNDISERFADAEWLSRLLADLGDEEQRLLAQLAPVAEGTTRDAHWAGGLDEARTPVRRLLGRGLLVGTMAGSVELPREVGLALMGERGTDLRLDPPRADCTAVGAADADAAAGQQALQVVRLVEDLLEVWGAEPPNVLRAGGLGVRELRGVAKRLEVEEPHAALVVEIAYAAGLLDQTDDFEPQWRPTPVYDLWRSRDLPQRWAELVVAWRDTDRAPSLAGKRDDTDKARPALSYELVRSGARGVRERTLQVLASVKRGQAPSPASVLDLVRWQAPLVATPSRDDLISWTLDEAAFLGVTGRGALSTAGRALLSDGNVAAAIAPHLPEPVDHILVQADLSAIAPGPLEPELARQLAGCADVESTGAATVYRFSESSLRRAYDAGTSAGELHSFLARVSRTPVPQTLTYLVDDLARRYGSLRVGSCQAYVRCDDPALLAEVVASKRTHSLGLHQVAPTVALCNTPPPRVLEVLRAAGYAPAGEAADGAVVLGRDDVLRAPRRRPRPRLEVPTISEAQVTEAVRRIREGDRVSASAQALVGPRLADRSSAATLAFLQQALEEDRSVWLGYVNAQGIASERIVVPVSLEGGFLSAYDEQSMDNRTFALHRITGVAPVLEERTSRG